MKERPLVLITGGAGFIGGHLSQVLLKSGFNVRILDPLTVQVHGSIPASLNWLENEFIEFIRGSVSNRIDLTNALNGVDYIVHLAAETGTGQSMYEIDRYYHVNCQSTALLFDILTNNSNHNVQRIVLASSRSIYGEGAYSCSHCSHNERVTPDPRQNEQLIKNNWDPLCMHCGAELSLLATNENDAIKPASMYASSKYAQEDIVRIGCTSLGIGYAILRLQNVYGEGQSLNNPYTGILSIFSTRIRRGLELPIFEDGQESRDFVHVEDVAGAMALCLNISQPPNETFNVGSGIATTVIEVAEQLTLALEGNSNIQVTGQYRIGDIRHNFADITKMKSLLGIEPKINLTEGLNRFANWVKEQPLPEDKLEQANKELQARKLMS